MEHLINQNEQLTRLLDARIDYLWLKNKFSNIVVLRKYFFYFPENIEITMTGRGKEDYMLK